MAENNKSANSLNLIIRFFLKKFRTACYSARESIGEHKRDIVVYQVEQTCISLKETRNEFEDALERFKNLVCVNETSLEHRYNLLNRQYQFCRSKSDTVSDNSSSIARLIKSMLICEGKP